MNSASTQSASAVLMVRPARFSWNPQTEASNRFQRCDATLAQDAAPLAQAEFDGLVARLQAAGVVVHAAQDRDLPACPDAVFPNNWVSFHADGTMVVYPLQAPNRRLERRVELATGLADHGYRVTRVLDLTRHELSGRFLEGTGSVVFDHCSRTAFASLSPRTDPGVLEELCGELGYASCTFNATDASGAAVYHTNVILSIGTGFAVVALESIDQRDRDRVQRRLAESGRDIIAIDRQQVAGFAGNVLELKAADGASVLALSTQARAALGAAAVERLLQHVERFADAPTATIETLGGGSVRCMLAEVFLPR